MSPSHPPASFPFFQWQGKRFFVGRTGATLGRRQTNSIAFSHESNGTVMGIDASISGEHARITYDEEGDYLCIMDGTHSKVNVRWEGVWQGCVTSVVLKSIRAVMRNRQLAFSLWAWRFWLYGCFPRGKRCFVTERRREEFKAVHGPSPRRVLSCPVVLN